MHISNEDVQRYGRIVLQWIAAALVSRGAISPDASWLEPTIGALLGIATLIWTVYGNRIQAKVNEVANIEVVTPKGETIKLVETMKVNDAVLAQNAPANVTPTPDAKKGDV